MKKLISTLAIVVACAANADYIYWFVDNPTDVGGTSTEWTSAAFFQDSSKLGSIDAETMDLSGSYVTSLLSNYDTATFYIELYNSETQSDSTSIGKATIPYSAIASNVFKDNDFSAPGSNKFNASASATFNVPEPTSGLLFLVGGMLLGLKRRRQQV